MIATNKRYSYLRVTVIRIDVHPVGEKPDPHATHFPRSVSVWPSTIRISRGTRISTFHVAVNRFEQIHCPGEQWLLTQSIARRLTDPWVRTQLLSHNSQWSSGEKSSFCWQPAARLTGPIYQHVVGTFNTCSWGPTHRSLTDTGGGYNIGGVGFSYTTARPF
jgi:hypothetical protein